MNANQKQWYTKAKAGDVEAAKKLLKARRDYEYEMWQIVNVK